MTKITVRFNECLRWHQNDEFLTNNLNKTISTIFLWQLNSPKRTTATENKPKWKESDRRVYTFSLKIQQKRRKKRRNPKRCDESRTYCYASYNSKQTFATVVMWIFRNYDSRETHADTLHLGGFCVLEIFRWKSIKKFLSQRRILMAFPIILSEYFRKKNVC